MTNKKRLVFISLALIILLSIPLNSVEAVSKNRNIKIWIDDFYIMSDVHPFLEKGTTFVPIRFIAEELGYDVAWDGARNRVSIENAGKIIHLEIGSNKVYVNGQTTYLDQSARLKQGRTFVPFRAVAELFGEKVEYDSRYKIAIIGDKYDPNTYYPLKYFLKNKAPFITVFKVNFVKYIVRFSDGRSVQLKTDDEIFNLVDKEGATHKEINLDSKVEEDKKIYDKHYIAPIEKDPFVGSWHGMTKTIGTDEYYDSYVYIEKQDENTYLLVDRSIKENGSQLITESYAKYNPEKNILIKERSHKTTEATGDFNRTWYSVYEEYKVEDFNYMYIANDPKRFLRKY